eukprot:7706509-Lingulodinium_polyedra.AAC.1
MERRPRTTRRHAMPHQRAKGHGRRARAGTSRSQPRSALQALGQRRPPRRPNSGAKHMSPASSCLPRAGEWPRKYSMLRNFTRASSIWASLHSSPSHCRRNSASSRR